MTGKIGALVAVIPLAIAASPMANARTNLVVGSDSDCPSGQAVAEVLWAIRPDREWPALTATIHVTEHRMEVVLGEDRSNPREIPAPVDCTERATRIALVIAVWSGEIPAQTTGAPSLSVAVPVPAPVPAKKSAMVTELGLSGFYSMVGGRVPGAQVEIGRFRRDKWWGARAMAAYQSSKSLPVDIGISRYNRAMLGAAFALRWNGSRVFLSSDLGLVGAFTRAQGAGYSQNRSAHGVNVGLTLDGRMGLKLGTFRAWANVRLYRWANQETIRVDSLSTAPSTATVLPTWDAHLGLGAGVVFD